MLSATPRRGLAATAVAVSLLASSAAAAAPDAAVVRASVEQVLASKGLGSTSSPGCAISVVSDDHPLFSAAYGAADLDQRTPFSQQTISETGSVAKQFTAAEILLLAEQGRLSLDDDIRKYLPEMPDYGAPVRIYDLLHQISGVREWSTLAALRGYPRFYRKIYGMDDLLRLVSSQRTLNFAPGTRYEYSNSNYGLLTIIVERVSGLSAAQFGRRFLFEPLGMSDSQWRDDLRRIVPGRAMAYRKTASGYEQAMPFENVYGHGALLTTVGDLQIWNRAILSGRLSPFVTRHMLEPGQLADGSRRAYGGGIVVTDYRGHRVYRHGGNTAGYTAQLWAFPDDRLSIATLCNVQAGDMAEIAARAADAALGLTPPLGPPPPGLPMPAGGAPAYFRSAGGEVVAVQRQGDRVLVNLFNRKGFVALIPGATSGRFTSREDFNGLDLRFEGQDRIVANLDGHDPTTFARIAVAAPRFTVPGRYESADLKAAYVVRRDGADYRMDLADQDADDPLRFNLERLEGDTYLARLQTRSGYIRDDFAVTFTSAGLTLSAVMGLQAVDNLAFRRVPR